MGGGHREKGQRRRKCDGERKMERGSGIKSGQTSELNDQDQISQCKANYESQLYYGK